MKNSQTMGVVDNRLDQVVEADQEKRSPIQIRTLGKFDVIKEGKSLVENAVGSKKLWELYQFMFSNREKTFSPDSLMNQLWVDEDYSDPRSTLRRQMFRLRKLLGEDETKDQMTSILFVNGFYLWNKQIPIELDADLFIQYINEADVLRHVDDSKALEYYELAIEMYKDDYLPQCDKLHWVFSIRNHLRHAFLDAVMHAASLMKQFENYAKLIALAEKAIQIDFYEEAFHYILMETKLIKGEYKNVLEHYQFVIGQYKQEMGIEPSNELKKLYQQVLQSHQVISTKQTISEAFDMNKEHKNAYYCEPDIFKAIFELELRRCEREGVICSLGVLTFDKHKSASNAQCEVIMKRLKTHLLQHLRKGDALSQWNRQQMIVLLSGVDSSMTQKILQRILEKESLFDVISISQATELKELSK